MEVLGNSMWRFQQKLKALGRNLRIWSKNEIGNVYQKVEEWQEVVQNLEEIDLNTE